MTRIGWVRSMSIEAKRFESLRSFEAPVPGGCQKFENGCFTDISYLQDSIALPADSTSLYLHGNSDWSWFEERQGLAHRLVHACSGTDHMNVPKLLLSYTKHPFQLSPFSYISLLKNSSSAAFGVGSVIFNNFLGLGS